MKAKKLTRETIRDLGITKRDFPSFAVGDTIEVAQIIKEGDKERIQLYEGDVIAEHRNGIASTFTVRRMSANGVAVERVFDSIRFVREGDVRRAKLYYVRNRVGKAARFKEKIRTKQEKEIMSGSAAQ
jgi:large subunit ribosomal protein L19